MIAVKENRNSTCRDKVGAGSSGEFEARRFNEARSGGVLSGFTFPKFYSSNCLDYFKCLDSPNRKLQVTLYALPILEERTIAFRELGLTELSRINFLLEPYKGIILNFRAGEAPHLIRRAPQSPEHERLVTDPGRSSIPTLPGTLLRPRIGPSPLVGAEVGASLNYGIGRGRSPESVHARCQPARSRTDNA